MAITDKSYDDKCETLVRQRKAHKKSRLGCKNCKLRGVKVSCSWRMVSESNPSISWWPRTTSQHSHDLTLAHYTPVR
jgi:hypothetical protein